MRIRTVALFGALAIALGLGVMMATTDISARMTGWIAIGLIPFTWAALWLIERLRGRDIWQFRAPYPYRWMKDTPEHDERRAA